MRKIPIIVLSLLLAATISRALCPPDPPSGDAPEPAVTVARADAGFAVTVRLAAPACLSLLTLVTQGKRVPYAGLQGPSAIPVSKAAWRQGTGQTLFAFATDAWLPAGETRYVLWFPDVQRYASLELTFRHGHGARIVTASWGAPAYPVRAPAPRARPAPARQKQKKPRKPPPRRPVTRKRR